MSDAQDFQEISRTMHALGRVQAQHYTDTAVRLAHEERQASEAQVAWRKLHLHILVIVVGTIIVCCISDPVVGALTASPAILIELADKFLIRS